MEKIDEPVYYLYIGKSKKYEFSSLCMLWKNSFLHRSPSFNEFPFYILHTFMLTYMVSFMLVCMRCCSPYLCVLSIDDMWDISLVWVYDDIWVLKNIIRFIMQRNSGLWGCLRLLPRAILPLYSKSYLPKQPLHDTIASSKSNFCYFKSQ